MSIEALSATLHHSTAKGTAKLVLMGIAWHTGDDPTLGCYPSQAVLAAYANTTVRQVRRCLLELEEIGELEIMLHDGRGHRPDRKTNRYWIRLDCPEWCDNTLNHREIEIIESSTGGHLWSNDRTSKVNRPDI